MSQIRVRFAPSPTGYLHIGGARTALYNYLLAQKHQGTFVLRIEDTDEARSTDESTQAILDGLSWLGLNWNEGPFFQSKRSSLYQEKLDQLLKEGKAYKCFLTKEELEARKTAQLAKGIKTPRYDGREDQLKNQNQTGPYVVRFLVPKGKTVVHDTIKGDVTFSHFEIEDLVLARSDGTFTYNFVVVVDDIDMKITHVIRGDDHLNNTPKQILIYEALGATVPAFAHLPLILGNDKQRLSKRHGATSVMMYRDMGYLPHALINFLARIGWSFKDEEIFSKDDLIQKFSLESVGKSAGVFNQEKLLWLNQHYIKQASLDVLKSEMKYFLKLSDAEVNVPHVDQLLNALRERAKTTKEMADLAAFFFRSELAWDEKAKAEYLKSSLVSPFEKLITLFSDTTVFDEANLKPLFENLLKELNLKMKDLAQPMRVALVGGTVSPGIFEVMSLLGKEKSLSRLKEAVSIMKQAPLN